MKTKTHSHHSKFFGVINLGSRLNHRSSAFMVGSSNSSATSSFRPRKYLHNIMRNSSSEALRHEGLYPSSYQKTTSKKTRKPRKHKISYKSKTHFIREISRDQKKQLETQQKCKNQWINKLRIRFQHQLWSLFRKQKSKICQVAAASRSLTRWLCSKGSPRLLRSILGESYNLKWPR